MGAVNEIEIVIYVDQIIPPIVGQKIGRDKFDAACVHFTLMQQLELELLGPGQVDFETTNPGIVL